MIKIFVNYLLPSLTAIRTSQTSFPSRRTCSVRKY